MDRGRAERGSEVLKLSMHVFFSQIFQSATYMLISKTSNVVSFIGSREGPFGEDLQRDHKFYNAWAA